MNAQEYNLNIRVGYGFPQTVKISQDDVGRPLSFHLLDGAEALTIPSGATVTIHGTKPSGLGFSETCTVTGSTASIETTLEMSQEFGNCPAELVVAVGDDLIGTANFTMFVERSPHPENTIDGTFDVADSIFARMDDLEDELDEVKEDIAQLGGLSDDVKAALLQLAQKVAYIDDDGETYYQDLYDALYPPEPPASLVSISAVYTQSGTVYDTDSLDSLKADLVVTALYDDQTTATVTAYTLSGTLTVGTSTITVAYGGKTTTFSVTVTKASEVPAGYTQYDYLTTTDTAGDYVDTGLVASTLGYNSFSALSTKIKMKLTANLSASTNIIGCRATSGGTGSTGAYQMFNQTAGTLLAYLLGASVTPVDTFPVNTVTEINYTVNDGTMSTLTIGNGTPADVASVSVASVALNNKSLILYGTNRNGTKVVGSTEVDVMELGDITLKNVNGDTVLRFVPAYSDSDAKYGFYETVHSAFYGCNLGTLTGGNWS